MSGPPIQQITKADSLTNIKNMNQLFFMYVGPQEGPLWDAYQLTASKLQPYSFFYFGSAEIAKSQVEADELPVIFVYKEGMHYFYPGTFGELIYWLRQ